MLKSKYVYLIAFQVFASIYGLMPISAQASFTIKCNWTIISSWKVNVTAKGKYDKQPILYKDLHMSNPVGCVSFDLSSPLPGKISSEEVLTLFETYQNPSRINLQCPKGYSSPTHPTWRQTGGVSRKSNSKTYYLDFFQAELPCIKDN